MKTTNLLIYPAIIGILSHWSTTSANELSDESLDPNKSTWHGTLLQGQFQLNELEPTLLSSSSSALEQPSSIEEEPTNTAIKEIKEKVSTNDDKSSVTISPPQAENIVGRWRYGEKPTTSEGYKFFGADFDFISDGTIVARFKEIDLADNLHEMNASGTWRIAPDGTIVLNLNNRPLTGTFSGDTLAIDIQGQIRKFHPISNDSDDSPAASSSAPN